MFSAEHTERVSSAGTQDISVYSADTQDISVYSADPVPLLPTETCQLRVLCHQSEPVWHASDCSSVCHAPHATRHIHTANPYYRAAKL